jgi:16S rRNA processing protein RimM
MAPVAGRRVRAGRVGRPHGLDGSFYALEASPALLVLGATVVVDGAQATIARRAGDDRRPIVRLEGHEGRPAAEALRDKELMVERSDAPELEEDEWWAEDLEGCAVMDGERRVGAVRRLVALPSVEALEVERDDGEGELLVPLVRDAVRDVDIERKRIDVDLRFLGEA